MTGMSGENWTRGPWHVGYGNGISGDVASWSVFLDEKQCSEIPIRSGNKAVTIVYYKRDEDENTANAFLMAAAPDLYEALEKLVAYTEACEGLLNATPAGQVKEAHMVLAKARGEE